MKTKLLKTLSCSLFIYLLSFMFISCGGGNHDAAIQTRIGSITQSNRELQGVSATVLDGVVTLIGQCKSEKDRERAEKDIKKIDDVKDVINNITVAEEMVVTSDSELKDQVSKAIKKYKHVRADVNDGIVTLRGQIDDDELQQMMMDINVLRPRRIDNQLVVE